MSGSANERYSRQILFSPIGAPGQLRLSQSVVAIVGCGATGSAVAALLARAGVGRLRIIDRDYVEASNLQRQSLFDEADARESLPKALAAARKIAQFNSAISIQPEVADLVPENAAALLGDCHLILDGTDNFETRYLINDFAWIYSAAVGSYCATMNVIPGETACLACIFPQPPRATETCDTVGILNSAVNLVASVQASEAIKFLVGAREQMRRSLLSWDVWSNQRAEVSAEKPRPDCRVCRAREFTYLEGKTRAPVTLLCGRDAVQIHESRRPVDFAELSGRLQPHGVVRHNEFVLKFFREPYEMTLFPDGRAIIKGTTDTAVARSLYARFVGT